MAQQLLPRFQNIKMLHGLKCEASSGKTVKPIFYLKLEYFQIHYSY